MESLNNVKQNALHEYEWMGIGIWMSSISIESLPVFRDGFQFYFHLIVFLYIAVWPSYAKIDFTLLMESSHFECTQEFFKSKFSYFLLFSYRRNVNELFQRITALMRIKSINPLNIYCRFSSSKIITLIHFASSHSM